MVTRESEATIIGVSLLFLFCLAHDLSHYLCFLLSLTLSFVSVPWTGHSRCSLAFLLSSLQEIS